MTERQLQLMQYGKFSLLDTEFLTLIEMVEMDYLLAKMLKEQSEAL